jgi:hypothetical protein
MMEEDTYLLASDAAFARVLAYTLDAMADNEIDPNHPIPAAERLEVRETVARWVRELFERLTE